MQVVRFVRCLGPLKNPKSMWMGYPRLLADRFSVLLRGALLIFAIWHDWHWNRGGARPMSSIPVVHCAVFCRVSNPM